MALASLRDLSRFPTSTLLPAITSTTASNTCTDSSSATSLDLGLGPSTQTKKWCFIAEITKVSQSEEYHTDLEVQDATGSRVRVVITAAVEGFPREGLSVGNMLLVLGAVRRALKDGSVGVEVDDVAKAKTLPIQIDQFMNLGRNVLHYNSVEDAKGLCNGCLRRKRSLHRCSGCQLFWYCNDTCQNNGYNKVYHKEICKILRDADVQALFRGSWNALDIFQSFVLQSQKEAQCDKGSHVAFVLQEMGHFLKC
ncbi:hypothetical protein BJX68DRAFT_267978 [Aspergillus pseudodeflectus]|uniref:MYND-type domain-containing protein n=1 Tax=Aspergillus pseudodeflectus TaxID=176178 RepID=A0ABR4K770_9EURO